MFSIVDAKATGKVSILTCNALWEYTKFVKDLENFWDTDNGRNILKCSANFGETPNKDEKHVHKCLTQTDDTYAAVFMGVRNCENSRDWIIFRREGTEVSRTRMNLFDTTDYVSCVFNMRNSGITYTRNDEKVSGRGKLNVKS